MRAMCEGLCDSQRDALSLVMDEVDRSLLLHAEDAQGSQLATQGNAAGAATAQGCSGIPAIDS
jgi:hypothetical protein